MTSEREQELLDTIEELEARSERYFQAFQRALPGHYQSVLWFHYTSNKDALHNKFLAWFKSDKNTVKPFDPEHWFRVFGLQEGDWKRKPETKEGGRDA
jgi:hypothetical protein